MAELRRNPFKNDWVMIASHRQNRPQMPKDWCPFCPGSGKVPEAFDVFAYDNDFPALSPDPPEPDDVVNGFFQVIPAYGKCEVILYSSEHTATLSQLPLWHVKKLVALWIERSRVLAQDPKVRYVFVFENRGEVVGVTMPHPHGQIYAYPFLPKKIAVELQNTRDYYQKNHRNLFDDWLADEARDGRRVIFENEHFCVVLPFFAENVYGVHIVAKAPWQYLWQMNGEQSGTLAETVLLTAGMLDSLYDIPFPYMMCMHQGPVNGEDSSEYYRFHIEFYPPMRDQYKQQFNASSETGAWAHCNPTAPEEKAQELREAYARFVSGVKKS